MKRKLFVLFLALSYVALMFAGCSGNKDISQITTAVTESDDTVAEATTMDKKDWLVHTIAEIGKEQRTTWNIEMKFLECTESAIVIEVIDHDNLGFMFTDMYYKLEVFKDGEWTQLSEIPESVAYYERGCIVPNLTKDYADFHSYSLLSSMPDVTLETGHYRLTKKFNRQDFSVEFDLNFD